MFIRLLEARDWAGWAALLDPDVVYELPQTRERIRGRGAYLQFNQEYPGDWHLQARVVLGEHSPTGTAGTRSRSIPNRSR